MACPTPLPAPVMTVVFVGSKSALGVVCSEAGDCRCAGDGLRFVFIDGAKSNPKPLPQAISSAETSSEETSMR